MEIEQVATKQYIVVKEKVGKYSREDIENLIKKDLEEHGLKAYEITFQTDYKYAEDEWGMNRHLKTIFNGATIKFE